MIIVFSQFRTLRGGRDREYTQNVCLCRHSLQFHGAIIRTFFSGGGMKPGLSFVVCCHNSAGRLPQTIKYLAAQRTYEGLQWEVVVVDNASTDDTVQVASSLWKRAGEPAPLRIVSEPRLGIGYARYRGIEVADYEFISFIDDDNWVDPDYARVGFEFMRNHPDVGSCGSLNEAVSDVDLPWWFERFYRSYAVGPQSEGPGDITWKSGVLWSAGMILRKTAIQELLDNGFSPMVVGAQGEKVLMRSEDYEMCLALRLRGWKLWYEPGLKLKHYLSSNRLEWNYLRRLLRGVGASDPGLRPYYRAGSDKTECWQWFFLRTAIVLLKNPWKLILSAIAPCEGDEKVLMIERLTGTLMALMRMRAQYNAMVEKVVRAGWIRKISTALTPETPVTQRPLVSVILCNYNYDRFVAEAVESVLEQTYKNFELIIVDDGSTDNSKNVISAYNDQRIKAVFKENGGQASAFNAGMKLAKGDFIAFLDSDDKWRKNKIEKVVQTYAKGDFSVVQHNLEIIDGNSQFVGRVHPGMEPGIRNVLKAYLSENRTNFFSSTSGIVCRMTDLMKIFPLDEENWKICADIALTRPLPAFGDICTLSENLGYYRIHDSNLWMNTESQSQWIKNALKEVEYTNMWLSKLGYCERINFTKSITYRNWQTIQMPFYHPYKLWRQAQKTVFWSSSKILKIPGVKALYLLTKRVLKFAFY